ncbi:hypothetical protein F2Q70_00007006 [Brassica cretica]|uniref:RNase H type-1 domain-containing protein n=1 Tax=Brassica cretica TaxID=69181 RepID=A0A8S9LWI9_BRACR|nr:hypothetical protein F2Q70_00007006 [Brassica cretica]
MTTPLYPWLFVEACERVARLDCTHQTPTGSPNDCSINNATQTQPPENSFLYFSDAAWNSASYAGGWGWICSDSAGATLLQISISCATVASALVAKALALKAAIVAAKSLNIKDLICCSDSKGLINLITRNTFVIALQGILHDISALSNSFSSIVF